MLSLKTQNLSIIIPAITLMVSIVSPVIVALINNVHNSHMKRMELKYEKLSSYYEKQQEVFSNFLSSVSRQIESNYQSQRIEYIRCYNELFLYTPSKYWDEFQKLNELILSRNTSEAKVKLSSVAKTLGKILQISEKQFPKI